MRYLYSAALYCLIPVILLRMLLRSRRAPAYRQRLAERFGVVPADPLRDNRPAIWLHAVSVGETLAAVPLIEELLKRYPEHRMVVTTTTPTGSERVRALFEDRVFHVYAPWDLPGAVRRFLNAVEPQLLLIMETELWPNMLHYSCAKNCRIILANARMSQRSAAGYLKFPGITHAMLSSLDVVACQSRADGDRLLELGLGSDQLQITGSIKFDLELHARLREQARELSESWGTKRRSVLVAASTHPGEDELILEAFSALKRQVKNALLILVPRHPERFEAVCGMCEKAGWQVCRRSAGIPPLSETDIIIGDTMGELLLLLSLADVAIIGGSLVPHGGHNVLEASVWGVPVVTGPHMFNFTEISGLLTAAGAMVALGNAEELAPCLIELFADRERRTQMGEAGLRVVANNTGAKKHLLSLIDNQLGDSRSSTRNGAEIST